MIANYFLFVMILVTLVLELVTGFAVAGWNGDRGLVERAKQPTIYWFVMILQIACYGVLNYYRVLI